MIIHLFLRKSGRETSSRLADPGLQKADASGIIIIIIIIIFIIIIIIRGLWYPEVHFYIHKGSLMTHILSRNKPTFRTYLLRINFNIVLPSSHRPS